ncbi:MAG TPA: NUDIX hydrolase [Vicinamibacterales bacterium]|nr:NUDIX hydrolase [Vicinamibacterales bacterium]
MAIVYKGRIFSVDVETVRTPTGRAHEMATIRHGPCVVVIPILDDGRVVMIRQFRHSVGRDLWELPAGNVDAGESVEAAARRECEEETQLAPEHIEKLGALFPAPGYSDEEMFFFRASGLRPPAKDSPHKPDDDESIEVHPMTVAEAKAMVDRGDVVDLKTAYGLTLI